MIELVAEFENIYASMISINNSIITIQTLAMFNIVMSFNIFGERC